MRKVLFPILFFIGLFGSEKVAARRSLYELYHIASGVSKVLHAATLDDNAMADAVAQTMAHMDEQSTICSAGSKYTKRLRRLTAGMTEIDGIPLNFAVYQDSETVNAFAAPDGSVRIYSCLMDAMTDDELLGVIAHEIGHVEGRHSLSAYRNALLVSAARDGLMLNDGKLGLLAASSLGDLSEVLIHARYSRTQESQADRYGYCFLQTVGKNPQAMIRALSKLQQFSNSSDNRYVRYVETLFSDHPDLDNRIADLQTLNPTDCR